MSNHLAIREQYAFDSTKCVLPTNFSIDNPNSQLYLQLSVYFT